MHTQWLLRIDRWFGGMLLLFCRRWRRRQPSASVRTVLIFKFMGGGSITVAGPLLLALRRKYAGARLVLVSTSQVAVHARLLGLFDQIEAVDDGRPFRLAFSLLAILYRCRRLRPELAVNLEVYSRMAVFCMALTGGLFRAGFQLEDEAWIQRCYDLSLPFSRTGRVYEYYDALAEMLDAPLPEPEALRRLAGSGFSTPPAGAPLLVAAPFCSALSFLRRWEFPCWSEFFAGFLAAHPDWHVLVIGGPKDVEYARGILDQLPPELAARAESGCGRLSLRESVAAIHRSALFVGIDSAPLHWARLTGRRVLSLWGATEPELLLRPAPQLIETVIQAEAECSPCVHAAKHSRCSGRAECMAAMTPDRVLAEAEHLLRRTEPELCRITLSVKK